MKKTFLVLVAAAFLLSATTPVFAAGGKWHGDRWDGGPTPSGADPLIKQEQRHELEDPNQEPNGKNPDWAGPDSNEADLEELLDIIG